MMSDKDPQLETFQTILLGNGIVYVKPNKNLTLEEEISQKIIDTCVANMEHEIENIGLIINMTRVAFITEGAMQLLSDDASIGPSISHLALVSNSHLSNVISTLAIQNCSDSQIKSRLFQSSEDAVDWLQEHKADNQLLEAAC